MYTAYSVNEHWKSNRTSGSNKIPEIPYFSTKNLSAHFTGINRQDKNNWNPHALNALIRIFKIHFSKYKEEYLSKSPSWFFFIHVMHLYASRKYIGKLTIHTDKEKIYSSNKNPLFILAREGEVRLEIYRPTHPSKTIFYHRNEVGGNK